MKSVVLMTVALVCAYCAGCVKGQLFPPKEQPTRWYFPVLIIFAVAFALGALK